MGAAVLLSACTGSSGGVAFRDLTLALPDGWVVVDETSAGVYVGNGSPSEDGQRGDLSIGMEITHRPDVDPADLRAFVEQEGGTLERDDRIEIDGISATLIQYAFTTNGTPTRERVVIVPSREIQLLQQPVPMQGETDGPDRFLANLEVFDQLLAAIDFGAPEGFLDE